MILCVQQGLRAEGVAVGLSQFCRWFEVARLPYQTVKAQPKIEALIEENPSFGHRTVAHLLGFNKNTVQRIFQRKG